MRMPGIAVSDIDPWKEGDELWPGLRVRFPENIASHSSKQEFYFGLDRLLRRHDYRLDVAGGLGAAQYVHDVIDVDGPGRLTVDRRSSTTLSSAMRLSSDDPASRTM
jgi:hypothetical protein